MSCVIIIVVTDAQFKIISLGFEVTCKVDLYKKLAQSVFSKLQLLLLCTRITNKCV